MVKHIWSVLAQSISVDQQTNNLSIFGALEEITVNAPEGIKLPATVPYKHTIVSFWQKETIAEELIFDLILDIMGPDGNKIGGIRELVKIPAQNKKGRTIVQMDFLPIVGAGQYIFSISAKLPESDVTKYAEIPLDVKIPKVEQ